jgi:hypothetical protein
MTHAGEIPAATDARPRLAREMGLLGLTATGVCSMIGAGINVIPFMIQRNVPGIADDVLPAYAFAAMPPVLAGLAYADAAGPEPGDRAQRHCRALATAAGALAALGGAVLAGFLVVHTIKDLTAPVAASYFRSTPVWLLVMTVGSFIYWREVRALRRAGVDLRARVAVLPSE